MIAIIAAIIIIFIILILWCWHNLGFLEKEKKMLYLAFGIIFVGIFTLIIFQFSKTGVNYPNQQIESMMKKVLVSLFIGINGCLILPYLAKILDQVNEEIIDKNKFKKKCIILLIIFFVIAIFECSYIRNTQQGIIKNIDVQIKENSINN